MIKRLIKWLTFPKINLHEQYLSQSTDMCDLERRLEKLRRNPHIVW